MSMYSSHFGVTGDGEDVTLFTLANINGYEVDVINYGCTIVSLRTPDRNGKIDDIVLGYDTLEEYLNSNYYHGCIVGRYANRIKNGKFILDGKEHQLSKNLNEHHIHGGFKGFDKVIWKAEPFTIDGGEGINFFYFSVENEEGYPGNLRVKVQYMLTNTNELQFRYYAQTDKNTIINLTQHAYYNLDGKGDILSHNLNINADSFLIADENKIPTGEITSVEKTSFDFKKTKTIGVEIANADIKHASGYDNDWVLIKTGIEPEYAATLYSATSGRKIDLFTTEPSLHIYTANGLNEKGKRNTRYGKHSGICLETQHFPDSPNHPEFPSVILQPGETYHSMMLLKFSTDYNNDL